MNSSEESLEAADARPRMVEELLSALHLNFSDNFATSKPQIGRASNVELQARESSAASNQYFAAMTTLP